MSDKMNDSLISYIITHLIAHAHNKLFSMSEENEPFKNPMPLLEKRNNELNFLKKHDSYCLLPDIFEANDSTISIQLQT